MYVIRGKKSGVGMETRTMQGLGRTRVRASELQLLADSVNGGQSKGTHMHTLTDSEVNSDNCVCRGGKQNSIRFKRKLLTGVQTD